MHTQGGKSDQYAEWKLAKDEEGKLLDRFRDPNDPLKFLIVTSKLLTGFDAPILQVMYLDKPMKDHNLLQAICCSVPCDSIPYRSYPLFLAREVLRTLRAESIVRQYIEQQQTPH